METEWKWNGIGMGTEWEWNGNIMKKQNRNRIEME
jgi:hypothetical protein